MTPFGTIYSTNITADRDTGIGNWSADDFYRALHDGVAPGGKHLYPAFPYIYFRRLSRQDSDDLYAFLHTLKAGASPAHAQQADVSLQSALWDDLLELALFRQGGAEDSRGRQR